MHQKCNRKGRGSHFPNFQEIFAFFEDHILDPIQGLKSRCFGMKIRYEIFQHFTRIPTGIKILVISRFPWELKKEGKRPLYEFYISKKSEFQNIDHSESKDL